MHVYIEDACAFNTYRHLNVGFYESSAKNNNSAAAGDASVGETVLKRTGVRDIEVVRAKGFDGRRN